MHEDAELALRPSTFTVQVDQDAYEVSSLCPHRQGWLEHGTVNAHRRTIMCPLHFSVFSLESGEQLTGPPCGNIRSRKLT